jgi:hypothetical protein
MKKNMATAMAAAMAFGSVVPAFAATSTQLTLESYNSESKRTATGYALVSRYEESTGAITTTATAGGAEVFNRAQIYDYNGTSSTSYTSHTLKQDLVDAGVEVIYADTDADEYVLAVKITSNKNVVAAKANYEYLYEQIAAYEAAGYAKETVTVYNSVSNDVYAAGYIKYVLTKTGETTVTVIINDVDTQEASSATDKSLSIALRKTMFAKMYSDYTKTITKSNITSTSDLGAIKYILTKYADKVDIVKSERNSNKDLLLKIYRKGSDRTVKDSAGNYTNLIASITLAGVNDIDELEVPNVPVTNDFSSHWAYDNIMEAMMNGDVDASANFRPNASVTRAEFAKMVANVLGFVDRADTTTNRTSTAGSLTAGDELVEYESDETYKETFHDVKDGDWFQNYVAFLQSNEIVQGDDNETFRPNDAITRQEAAVMVANAFNKFQSDSANMTGTQDGNTDSKQTHVSISKTAYKALKYKDKADIAIWADHSVNYLSQVMYDEDDKLTILGGDTTGKFNPTANITRAESLVIVQRAVTALNK